MAEPICQNCKEGWHCCCQGDFGRWCLCNQPPCAQPFLPFCGKHRREVERG